ncbi:YaiO family outer membrane beta-barrel protein [Pedobacter aquatilis]|uniref:YaiO family outer membrane beta-barrel protein n=1 Tax=Pedobacter aquatilis TaxID=351343 RepID=UPI00292D9C3C|nr:YaiO family outer membrane beta-barrel protein [Pedobacter aquatilis]
MKKVKYQITNNGNYNMYRSRIKTIGLILFMCLFSRFALAQKVSSDELLKQAVKETNISKNYVKAIQLAKKGLALSPGYVDIKLLLGRLYILTNQNEAAAKTLNEVLRTKPGQKDALNYLLNLYYEQNNLPKAISYAQAYLKYFPDDKSMQQKRIAMLYQIKDFTNGAPALANLYEKFPADQDVKNLYIDSHTIAAKYYRDNKDLPAAVAEYEKILALRPTDQESLEALYNLEIQRGDKEKALSYATLLERSGNTSIAMRKADLLSSMNRFAEAQILAEQLKNQNPNDEKVASLYRDIHFSSAKKDLEQKDTLNASKSYRSVLKAYPADTFSRNQLINLSVAKGERNNALLLIDEGQQYYADKESIQLKKLGILQDSEDKKTAYQYSKSLAAQYPESEKIRTINNDLFLLTRQNRIGLNYGITAFDQQGRKPWNLYSAWYMRSEEGGALVARLNYADRRDAKGYQFEVEAYPKHNTGYSYINLAYSNALIFPRFKFGYSYFLPFNNSWEAEMGVRYLNSYLNYYSITAGLGKYFGNFWLNGKTFITPNGEKVAGSYILSGRYLINGSPDDYFTAIAGYGFSPDDRGRNFEITERLNLQSVRFTLGYQRTLWKRNIVGLFGTWNNQEYVPGRKRNEFDAQISFQHKF